MKLDMSPCSHANAGTLQLKCHRAWRLAACDSINDGVPRSNDLLFQETDTITTPLSCFFEFKKIISVAIWIIIISLCLDMHISAWPSFHTMIFHQRLPGWRHICRRRRLIIILKQELWCNCMMVYYSMIVDCWLLWLLLNWWFCCCVCCCGGG